MFFQKKTVSSIIAGFNQMMDDLDKVAAECDQRCDDLDIEITQKQAERTLANAEATKALAVRENIFRIVEG